MNQVYYYPCNKKGDLLKGFCFTRGSMNGYLKDCRMWQSLGIEYVYLNGNVYSLI